jgi:hypothetical protein
MLFNKSHEEEEVSFLIYLSNSEFGRTYVDKTCVLQRYVLRLFAWETFRTVRTDWYTRQTFPREVYCMYVLCVEFFLDHTRKKGRRS